VELYVITPATLSWLGAQLKHRDNFTFAIFAVTEFGIPLENASMGNKTESSYTCTCLQVGGVAAVMNWFC